MVDGEYKRLAEQYKPQVDAWLAFYNSDAHDEAFEDSHFESLALGFFIALGVTGDSGTGEKFYDACRLAYIAEDLAR